MWCGSNDKATAMGPSRKKNMKKTNWNKVLNDAQGKDMQALVTKVMDKLRIEADKQGLLFPSRETRDRVIRTQMVLAAKDGLLPSEEDVVDVTLCVNLEQAVRMTVLKMTQTIKQPTKAAIDRVVKEIAELGGVSATVLGRALAERLDKLCDREAALKSNPSTATTWKCDGNNIVLDEETE